MIKVNIRMVHLLLCWVTITILFIKFFFFFLPTRLYVPCQTSFGVFFIDRIVVVSRRSDMIMIVSYDI